MRIDEFLNENNVNKLKKDYQDKLQQEKEKQRILDKEYELMKQIEKKIQLPIIKMFVEEVLFPNAKYKSDKIVLPKIQFYSNGGFSHLVYFDVCQYKYEFKKEYRKIQYNYLNQYLKSIIPQIEIITEIKESYDTIDSDTEYICSYSIDPNKINKNVQYIKR